MEKDAVIYYNGLSSRPFPAQIFLDEDSLFIEYKEPNGKISSVTWHLKDIHSGEYIGKNKLKLRQGDFPFESLEIDSPEILNRLKTEYPHKQFVPKTELLALSQTRKVILWGGGITVLLLALLYYWFLPSIAESIATKIPISYEKQIGESVYQNFMLTSTVDEYNTQLLNDFCEELQLSDMYDIEVTVVESGEMNAFALPGGHIVVYDQLLEEMESYEELAALLAHEAAHVSLRHSLKSLSRDMAHSIFLSWMFFGTGDLSSIFTENAHMIHSLKYSRELEKEADIQGVYTLIDRNIDPQGFIDLFGKFETGEESDAWIQYLSTHPAVEERITYIEQIIAKKSPQSQENPDLNAIWEEIQEEE